MVFPRINNPKVTTSETFAGDFGNMLSDYFSNVDISDTDPTNIPIINTPTQYQSDKFQILAGAVPIVFNAPSLVGTPVVSFPVTINTDGSHNNFVFENTIQPIKGKIIDAVFNTILNIDDPNISNTADISWNKISKMGSKLEDIGDIDTSTRNDGTSIMWSSELQKYIPFTPIQNPDVLLPNKTIEPTANVDTDTMYRHDIDVNNHRIFISKIENGQVIKVRVC